MQGVFSWFGVYAYTAFLITTSILPPTAFPKINIIFFDKTIHFIEYFLLAFMAINTALLCRKKHPYLFSFSYAWGVGLGIEALQFLLPYRSFEFSDVLSNSLGCLLGLFLRVSK